MGAFTLIELLTVIAIIGVLAAIALGAVSGIRSRALVAKSKTELATIAQALEVYKRQYGDYPQTGATSQSSTAIGSGPGVGTAQAKLFNALIGRLGPKLAAMTGRVSLDVGKLTLEMPFDESASGELNNAILDPWGNRYHYHYKSALPSPSWTAPSYVLYSAGPDGLQNLGFTPAGQTTPTSVDADNITANAP